MKPYEPFDHPADIGLIIRGKTQEELFTHAALGFADLVTDAAALASAVPSVERTIRLEAEDMPELLFSWLRELIYLFSASSVVFTRFEFSALTSGRLEAVARGISFDPARHVSKMEVKAVTRHQFSLSHTPAGGWEARVIFDV